MTNTANMLTAVVALGVLRTDDMLVQDRCCRFIGFHAEVLFQFDACRVTNAKYFSDNKTPHVPP